MQLSQWGWWHQIKIVLLKMPINHHLMQRTTFISTDYHQFITDGEKAKKYSLCVSENCRAPLQLLNFPESRGFPGPLGQASKWATSWLGTWCTSCLPSPHPPPGSGRTKGLSKSVAGTIWDLKAEFLNPFISTLSQLTESWKKVYDSHKSLEKLQFQWMDRRRYAKLTEFFF